MSDMLSSNDPEFRALLERTSEIPEPLNGPIKAALFKIGISYKDPHGNEYQEPQVCIGINGEKVDFPVSVLERRIIPDIQKRIEQARAESPRW